MKLVNRLFLQLFLFVSIFVLSNSLAQAERCCPDGMTRCDGVGNDMTACVSDGHRNIVGQGSDQWCGRTTFQYGVVVKERYTSPSFECDEGGNPVAQDLHCEWAPLNNEQNQYHGRPAYCVGGFPTEQALRNSTVAFSCIDNCGGALGQLANRIGSGGVQQGSTSNAEVGLSSDGTYYTCFTGDFDSSIKSAIESCLQDKGIATAVGGGTGFILGALVPGPNIVTIPLLAVGGATLAESVMGECEPTISAVTRGAGDSCNADLRIELNLDTQAGNLEGISDDYSICASNLGVSIEANSPYQNCRSCYEAEGIWTAAGCIHQNPRDMVSKVVSIGIGVLGGIFLLRVLAAGFTLTISQGDVKKTTEAKEMITEAIIGALFILFSVTILQFIGAGVLNIPGFG